MFDGSASASRCVVAALGIAILACAPARAQDPAPGFADDVLGRWDITVDDGTPYPSWLEVRLRTETSLMARFVGRLGSVRYVNDIRFDAGRLHFSVAPQYEPRSDALRFEGALTGAALTGTTTDANGDSLRWTGVRAPTLAHDPPRRWRRPIPLFDGHSLDGWHFRGTPDASCWRIDDGILASTPPCVDLISDRRFEDFRLHAEFRYPPGSNSGLYLRGRYEVQIQDDAGRALDALRLGGIYGFLAPLVHAGRPAGAWQTFDITLVGREVSVALNGTRIIDGETIPGITGGALDADEAAPGPLMLQGDHGPIQFRRLEISLPAD